MVGWDWVAVDAGNTDCGHLARIPLGGAVDRVIVAPTQQTGCNHGIVGNAQLIDGRLRRPGNVLTEWHLVACRYVRIPENIADDIIGPRRRINMDRDPAETFTTLVVIAAEIVSEFGV